MASSYFDTTAIYQVIGCVFNSPELLDEQEKYTIHEDDFVDEFHKIVFGSIYNIHLTGSKVDLNTVIDYLAVRPKFKAIFDQNKGIEYLQKISSIATKDTFNYYYSRLKKMSLLRAYDNYGLDVSYLYDPNNILDSKKKQQQEDWLDNTSLAEIATSIDSRIEEIKSKYVEQELGRGYQAGDGALELIARLEESPEIGIPMYGPLINTITRGARLRKFYLRSAATGLGKTRSMVADACNFATNRLYSTEFGMWINNGIAQPTLFIATEQDLSEIQTLMLAFLSGVNESHILDGEYAEGEKERVVEAARILKESPLWIEEMPDFSLQDIENKIKQYIREKDVLYICLDYIHSSMKILEEITKRSGGVKLREDNILFMLATKLKDICNQYGVFILSGTQLNANYLDSDTPDQNLLRGAKSIGDRVDLGMIMLAPTNDDLVKIEPVIAANPSFETPNMKISVYKNRRGAYKGIYLWCVADLGTCRIKPIFATNYRHELVPIEDARIIVDNQPSAF